MHCVKVFPHPFVFWAWLYGKLRADNELFVIIQYEID